MRCSLLVLSTYLDGELEAAKCGELEAHLVSCDRCGSGLGYLREEVARISALAPVHVPDHSVHALFEQLGLLGMADPLPYRSAAAVIEPPADAPPWFDAAGAGKALPWNPRARERHRPVDPAAAVMLPGHAQSDQTLPPGDGVIPDPAAARAINSRPAEEDPSPGPPGSSPRADGQIGEDQPPADGARSASMPHPPEQSRISGVDDVADTSSATTIPPVGGPPLVPPISTEPSPRHQRHPEAHTDDAEEFLTGEPQFAARPTVLERIRDRIGMYRALARGSHDTDYDDSVQIVSGVGAPLRPARGGTMYSHQSHAGRPPAAYGYPVHPSATVAAPEYDAPVGTGPEPAEAEFTFEPIVDPSPPSIDSEPDAFPAFSGRLGPIGGQQSPSAPPLHGEVVTAAAAPSPASSRTANPTTEIIEEDDQSFRSAGATRAGATVRSGERPIAIHLGRFRDSAGERRPLAVFGGAVAIMMIIGLAIGHSSAPNGAAVSSSPPIKPAVAAPLKPAVVPAVPRPAALTGEQDLGAGGSGYQVKGIRYGVHPGDFRIVFDLSDAGGAVGTPKAVIGWTTPTAFQVQFRGVIAAGSTGQLPPSAPVAGVALLQPAPVSGATVYQFAVTHAVTVTSAYTPTPLRLIIDLH